MKNYNNFFKQFSGNVLIVSSKKFLCLANLFSQAFNHINDCIAKIVSADELKKINTNNFNAIFVVDNSIEQKTISELPTVFLNDFIKKSDDVQYIMNSIELILMQLIDKQNLFEQFTQSVNNLLHQLNKITQPCIILSNSNFQSALEFINSFTTHNVIYINKLEFVEKSRTLQKNKLCIIFKDNNVLDEQCKNLIKPFTDKIINIPLCDENPIADTCFKLLCSIKMFTQEKVEEV